MTKRRRNLCRYTLIEMIVALTILVLASAAVTAAATGGLNIFKRARDYRETRVRMILALQRIERDLRSSFKVDTLPFEGEPRQVRIPTVVFHRSERRGEPSRIEPGIVMYYTDRGSHQLIRETLPYAHATAPAERPVSGQTTTVAENVGNIHFRYYRFDPDTLLFGWVNSWQDREGEQPLAVEVRLEPEDIRATESLTTTVLLPAGGIDN